MSKTQEIVRLWKVIVHGFRKIFASSLPHHSNVEIERRFLLNHFPDVSDCPSLKISQGYIQSPSGSVRLRRSLSSGSVTCFVTAKSGEGTQRIENECELPEDAFGLLWPTTVGVRLEKIRYCLPIGNLTAEIDVYQGSLEGHVQVEVEFTDMRSAEAFIPPTWFGEEVTQDRRYNNYSLAIDGAPVKIDPLDVS